MRTALALLLPILAAANAAFSIALADDANAVRTVTPIREFALRGPTQPAEYRYVAFPSMLPISADEIWIACKAGARHGSDAGAALEVLRHTLSSGETQLIQRLVPPLPKLYQMGEFARYSDGTIALHVDVNHIGWDGRTYRTGAEYFRWDEKTKTFGAPAVLAPTNGVLYGYPFDFITEGATTWQLIMAFGYHQPGGRWSVDALRSDDRGQTWSFVRNLAEEFGGIRANESAFVRHDDGFIVATRGYDSIARLHRTSRDFKVLHQLALTGKYPFINSYIGRPRIFIRDGQGYLIGRNWTRAKASAADAGGSPSEMQLCLFRFDLETLEVRSCIVLDNAEQNKVRDGYYAVVAFSGSSEETRLHVITYKSLNEPCPNLIRMDFRWADVK